MNLKYTIIIINNETDKVAMGQLGNLTLLPEFIEQAVGEIQ